MTGPVHSLMPNILFDVLHEVMMFLVQPANTRLDEDTIRIDAIMLSARQSPIMHTNTEITKPFCIT